MAEPIRIEQNDGILSFGPNAVNTINQVFRPSIDPPEGVPAPTGLVHLRRPGVTEAVFVGRAAELAALSEGLEASGPRVLTGLGGVGKSTMLEYWALQHRGRYNPVWWMAADGPEQRDAGLAALACRLHPVLGGHPVPTAVDWCRRWLSSHDGWLIILDNVGRPADVAELIGAAPAGQFLLTSRQVGGWAGIAEPIALDVLPPAPAMQMLTRLVGDERLLSGAGDLIAAVDGLPLALELAAGYLTQNAVTAGSYVNRLTGPGNGLLAWAPVGGDADRTIGRIWQMTLDRLAKHGPHPGLLLRTIAWWAPDGISMELLRAGTADGTDVDDAVGRLAAYALVSRDGDTISVHRLVQAANRAGPDDYQRSLDALHGPWERLAYAGEPEELQRHLEAALAYATAYPDEQDVLAAAARAADDLTDLGMGTPSIKHLKAILARQLTRLPADDVRVLATRHALAGAHVVNLHMLDAIETFKGVIADRARVLGRRHRDTLLARLHLSHAYGEDRPCLAARTLRGVVRDAARALGPDDPVTLLSRYELVTAYASAPRFRGLRVAATIRHYLDLVDGLERVAGPAAPETLRITGELADVFMRCGLRKKAISLLIDIVGRAEREYGADDPITRSSIEDLAMAYREANQPHRAIALYRRLLDAQPSNTVVNSLADARREAAAGE
jgi:hypothetical protein